ncbi:NAD(P)/FAD-dependent oxidoreductase [Chitinophaga barathri]|uniref:FAD-binding oxidoreductase n=1 Tax=Chitinophaga barathri TaxID=1647451 RepID=A0A3N4MEM3_9BACT|nr:FAD-dependent oxidoreductase [Chitinophaga barathri]RPD42038.1 FAD-binding oxidoreductase [Chitinophaga barathri]
MDLSSGYPFSLVKNGLPHVYPKLQQDIRTPVTVIGAGISGALTAYALVNAGLECTVVDARTVGLGSTCASTSLLQYEIDVPLTELTGKIGKAGAQRAYELCAASIGALEKICDKLDDSLFQSKESLLLASYKKDQPMLEAEFKARRATGLEVEWWDAATVKNNMGFTNPAAIWSATAAQTDAYMLSHALHQHNIRKGAKVYDRTLVKDIRFHKNGAELLTEGGPVIRTRHIVIATGYEALQYVPAKVVKLHSTYAVAGEHTENDTAWYRNCLIWETKDPYLYMRTTPDCRVIVGGRDEEYYNPQRRDKLLKLKTRQLQKDMQARFPDMDFQPEFAWTGTFGSTQDGLPYIGEYRKMPHTFFALGFGGNGITFSQIAAEIVCSLIQGKKHPDADLFSFDRFKG